MTCILSSIPPGRTHEDRLRSDIIDQKLPGEGEKSAVFDIAGLLSGSPFPESWLSDIELPSGGAGEDEWIPPFSPDLSRSDVKLRCKA
jgi:hypothetical protein